MSHRPEIYSPQPHSLHGYYASTPPAPPPKPPGTSTPARGPPLPPPPPGQVQSEPSELDASHSGLSRPQNEQHSSIPPVESNWLPADLKDKSTQDLHHLLSNLDLQAAILQSPDTTHPAISASESYLQPLINTNLSIAASTLELEARLSSLRERTQSRLLALRALEQQHKTKISETEAALRDFSPMALYQRLNASVQEQEQLIRGMEQSWLEEDGTASDREVGDFIRRVKEAKKVAFLRRERKARWDEGRVGGWR